MFAYSEDEQHFLGYRITSFGKVQVVYDCAGAKHKVFTVETPDVSGQVIASETAHGNKNATSKSKIINKIATK